MVKKIISTITLLIATVVVAPVVVAQAQGPRLVVMAENERVFTADGGDLRTMIIAELSMRFEVIDKGYIDALGYFTSAFRSTAASYAAVYGYKDEDKKDRIYISIIDGAHRSSRSSRTSRTSRTVFGKTTDVRRMVRDLREYSVSILHVNRLF